MPSAIDYALLWGQNRKIILYDKDVYSFVEDFTASKAQTFYRK
jgi:hypothetical protein